MVFECVVQDQKHPRLLPSRRVLKWFRFSVLIQRNSEKGFCPGRCYDEMEQTNHIRPYLTLFWFRLHLSSWSWCTAKLNIISHARATVSLSLFSIRSVVSGKSGSGHQDWWNRCPTRLFVSYISASKASTSRSDSWLCIERSGLHPQSSKLAFSKVSRPCLVLHSTFLGPFWATCNISMALRYKENLFVCLFQVVLHGKSCRLCHSL